MSSVRTFLCGLLGALTLVAGLAAQDLRETIGPLERQAKPITPENPIPRRTLAVAASGTYSGSGLPSTRRCLSRRRFAVNVRVPRRARLLSATVHVGGRRVARTRSRRVVVSLRGRERGRVTVKLVARIRQGGRTRTVTSGITPSVPSEAMTTSRSAGPAAVCGVSSVRRFPVGESSRTEVTSESKRP